MVDGSDCLVSSCRMNCKRQPCLTSANTFSCFVFFFPLCPTNSPFSFFLSTLPYLISLICALSLYPTVICPSPPPPPPPPPPPLCLHLQSNSLLPESLRNSDKRRNGPEFPNDTKKRKMEDKDSSHYVRNACATQTKSGGKLFRMCC